MPSAFWCFAQPATKQGRKAALVRLAKQTMGLHADLLAPNFMHGMGEGSTGLKAALCFVAEHVCRRACVRILA
jgi:hypothetical protein